MLKWGSDTCRGTSQSQRFGVVSAVHLHRRVSDKQRRVASTNVHEVLANAVDAVVKMLEIRDPSRERHIIMRISLGVQALTECVLRRVDWSSRHICIREPTHKAVELMEDVHLNNVVAGISRVGNRSPRKLRRILLRDRRYAPCEGCASDFVQEHTITQRTSIQVFPGTVHVIRRRTVVDRDIVHIRIPDIHMRNNVVHRCWRTEQRKCMWIVCSRATTYSTQA